MTQSILEAQGFTIENAAEMKVNLEALQRRGTRSSFALEHLKDSAYRRLFEGKPHQIFVGQHAELGPVVLCLKAETVKGTAEKEEEETEEGQYRAMLWSSKGRLHSTFPKTQYKPGAIFQAIAAQFELEKSSLKNMCRVSSQKQERLSHELSRLEEMENPSRLLFGVVYGQGDQREMDQMFSNREASPAFYSFMNALGSKIDLGSCENDLVKFAGFSGNDDRSIEIYTTDFEGYELIFHVSPLLPYVEGDSQQLVRKRKIGNDIVVLVFHEGDVPFQPTLQTSKVNHINMVVKPHPQKDETVAYTVSVANKLEVPEYGPQLRDMEFSDAGSFRRFILAKLVNGSRSAFNNSPGFKREATLSQLLQDILGRYVESQRWSPWSRSLKKQKSVLITKEESESGVCAACKQLITSSQKGVSALGNFYHSDHFCCEHCGLPFEDKPFVLHPTTEKAYCEKDYNELFNPVCCLCNEQVDYFIRAMGKVWHMSHFCCAACQEPIGEETYFENDGQPYCSADYKALFLPICEKCGEPIEGLVTTFREKKYHPNCHVCQGCSNPMDGACLVALGGIFHPACFSCKVCQKQFGKDCGYFLLENIPYCDFHYNEKIGRICFDCKQPIVSGKVSRLGERLYHADHFKCESCHTLIGAEESFYMKNNGPACEKCSEDL